MSRLLGGLMELYRKTHTTSQMIFKWPQVYITWKPILPSNIAMSHLIPCTDTNAMLSGQQEAELFSCVAPMQIPQDDFIGP